MSWCDHAGHNLQWHTVGEYRVRFCTRWGCHHIVAVVTWHQHPCPPNPEIGWTTKTDPPW